MTHLRSDYGGMDVYVNQIVGAGSAHDLFYTNSKVMVSDLRITASYCHWLNMCVCSPRT